MLRATTSIARTGSGDVLEDLRTAFNHLLQSEDELQEEGSGVSSLLNQQQREAADSYFRAIGCRPFDPRLVRDDLSPSELETLDLMKQKCDSIIEPYRTEHPEIVAFVRDDSNLVRFLRARDFHLDKAVSMIEGALKWRAEMKPDTLFCEFCAKKQTCADLRIVGFDKKIRPVVYSSFARTPVRTPERTVLHSTCVLEKARHLRHEGGEEGVVWVNNFNDTVCCVGFGWRDLNPRFAGSALTLFNNQYPECLGTMIVVDPPAIFWGLFKVMKPLLSEKTALKVQFLDTKSGDETALNLLNQYFKEDLSAFILDQCRADYK